MSNLKTITIADNEKFLRQISKSITFPDKELDKNIEKLEQYFNQCDTVLALAAVQLGISKRLIYLKNTDLESVRRKNTDQETLEDKLHNEKRILINPVIISKEGLTDYWETCASCLDYMGHVRRPYKIVIEYQDTQGNVHRDTFEGFESTVLSHEMDHLDGILHMDVADEVLEMPIEERQEFRKNHDYNIVSKTGVYEELLKDNKK